MKNNLPVLLVEDDQVDVMTVKRAFKEIKILNEIVVCGNGIKALEYLQDPQTTQPGLILLDLNMPKMSGLEFLQVIKTKPELKRIPIVVLTTSQEEQDRIESFNLSVAGYMIKPVSYQKFVEVIRIIHVYWELSEGPFPED